MEMYELPVFSSHKQCDLENCWDCQTRIKMEMNAEQRRLVLQSALDRGGFYNKLKQYQPEVQLHIGDCNCKRCRSHINGLCFCMLCLATKTSSHQKEDDATAAVATRDGHSTSKTKDDDTATAATDNGNMAATTKGAEITAPPMKDGDTATAATENSDTSSLETKDGVTTTVATENGDTSAPSTTDDMTAFASTKGGGTAAPPTKDANTAVTENSDTTAKGSAREMTEKQRGNTTSQIPELFYHEEYKYSLLRDVKEYVAEYVKYMAEGKPWSAFRIADLLPAGEVYTEFGSQLGVLEVTLWIKYFHHSRFKDLVYERLESMTRSDRKLWADARYL